MNISIEGSAALLDLRDPLLFREQCYIDGGWTDADNGKTLPVDNPATGELLGTVPDGRKAETRRAIEAANSAFPVWRARTAKERATILRKWFELMMANQEDLARIMTAEQGKPLAESRGEIAYAATFIEWFAEEGKRIYGDTIPQHQADKRIVVLKEPIGVCVAITPWNFPAAMITRKVGPALAAGCTMVVKPASATPFSALAMAELAERAGVPKGVLSVVTGSAGAIGGEMSTNPLVRKLTFTGSTEVGKKLMAQCAGTVKKTSMELGGNAPFIVFDDADLDAAVEGAIDFQVPQQRPDLRLRQPPAGAGQCLRCLRCQTGRAGGLAQGRQWDGDGRGPRAAHRSGCRSQGRGAYWRRARQGGQSIDGRKASSPGRTVL